MNQNPFFSFSPILSGTSFAFILFVSSVFVSCKEATSLPFGVPMKMKAEDTGGMGKTDAFGYYLNDKGNYRVVYIELDKNGDKSSDEMIWLGTPAYLDSNNPVPNQVKIHEEVDENYDGKIDMIKWLLPNDLIAMAQKDADRDGYFETTLYYNVKKSVVRREIDTNKDGFADITVWSTRAEVDSDFDKIPDFYINGSSDLELERKATQKVDTIPLNKSNSWFLNPSLVPEGQRAILQAN